jgi:hypothetical protein
VHSKSESRFLNTQYTFIDVCHSCRRAIASLNRMHGFIYQYITEDVLLQQSHIVGRPSKHEHNSFLKEYTLIKWDEHTIKNASKTNDAHKSSRQSY